MITPASLLPLLLLLSQAVAASNLVRDESTSTDASSTTSSSSSSSSSSSTAAPTPWLSVIDADGTVSTVTPIVSTDSSGQPTTIDAKPTDAKPTATNTPDTPNKNSKDVFARCDSTKYELAETGNVQPYVPFCAPRNGTNWWYSGNYYVTWNPAHYPANSTVNIVLNYEVDGGAGRIARIWHEVPNAFGFINVEPDQKWLLNQTALATGDERRLANQTMSFTIANNIPSTSDDNITSGPTIVLTAAPTPAPIDKDPRNRPAVSTLGLAIGLPLLAVFAFGSVLGLHFCMRNKRKVGPISIGGGRKHFSKRGYSGRAERRRQAARGGEAEYRDEMEDGVTTSPSDERSADWELANVKGGR